MNRPMKMQYVKISNTIHKFFYEDGKAYGEFYIELKPDATSPLIGGKAILSMKDPAYGKPLMDGLNAALVEYTNFKEEK